MCTTRYNTGERAPEDPDSRRDSMTWLPIAKEGASAGSAEPFAMDHLSVGVESNLTLSNDVRGWTTCVDLSVS